MAVTYFQIGMVPREYAAFENYRWDLIVQGCGPETILVHNGKNLSAFIAECSKFPERWSIERPLCHLHSLMVMFQSGDPRLWIDAAFKLKE